MPRVHSSSSRLTRLLRPPVTLQKGVAGEQGAANGLVTNCELSAQVRICQVLESRELTVRRLCCNMPESPSKASAHAIGKAPPVSPSTLAAASSQARYKLDSLHYSTSGAHTARLQVPACLLFLETRTFQSRHAPLEKPRCGLLQVDHALLPSYSSAACGRGFPALPELLASPHTATATMSKEPQSNFVQWTVHKLYLRGTKWVQFAYHSIDSLSI